ncbi:DUF3775 domain-containing protein [Legionella yabuuchiae]|uniref:DUF3775 domain-containing protein n=1 Tax=Legionella yabuuchiae TaxID=376727 RepID=UPI001055CAE9|nr:DUF3775 domain-containing protein [Legionella yabuuchiae]
MFDLNELTINPVIVCNLIQRAKEFHAKEEVSIPEASPNTEYEYDWAQVLADHYDDLTYLEIKNAIVSLPYDKRVDLLALMYLGREDFVEWEDARAAAINNLPSNLTDYLLGHPFLSDYLEKALAMFGQSCEE